MKMKFLFFWFSFVLMTKVFSQKKYLTEHPVYLDVIKQYIYVFSNEDSTIRTNKGDQEKAYIKIFDLTEKGAMNFVLNDTVRNVSIVGQYSEALKLSKPKNYKRDGARVVTSKNGASQYYYKPLRDGVWYYYDTIGNVVHKEKYKRGVLLKE